MNDVDTILQRLIAERDGDVGAWWSQQPNRRRGDVDRIITEARKRGGWRNIRLMPKPSELKEIQAQ